MNQILKVSPNTAQLDLRFEGIFTKEEQDSILKFVTENIVGKRVDAPQTLQPFCREHNWVLVTSPTALTIYK